MEIIEIQTLLDITNTNVIRHNQGSQLQLDQNRNFITLLQCVGIRSIVSYEHSPTCDKVDIKSLGFGSAYKGKQTVWTFRFVPDRAGVYEDSKNNNVGCLLSDLTGVPVIKNLTETINIEKAIFELSDTEYTNTIISTSIVI